LTNIRIQLYSITESVNSCNVFYNILYFMITQKKVC